MLKTELIEKRVFEDLLFKIPTTKGKRIKAKIKDRFLEISYSEFVGYYQETNNRYLSEKESDFYSNIFDDEYECRISRNFGSIRRIAEGFPAIVKD